MCIETLDLIQNILKDVATVTKTFVDMQEMAPLTRRNQKWVLKT